MGMSKVSIGKPLNVQEARKKLFEQLNKATGSVVAQQVKEEVAMPSEEFSDDFDLDCESSIDFTEDDIDLLNKQKKEKEDRELIARINSYNVEVGDEESGDEFEDTYGDDEEFDVDIKDDGYDIEDDDSDGDVLDDTDEDELELEFDIEDDDYDTDDSDSDITSEDTEENEDGQDSDEDSIAFEDDSDDGDSEEDDIEFEDEADDYEEDGIEFEDDSEEDDIEFEDDSEDGDIEFEDETDDSEDGDIEFEDENDIEFEDEADAVDETSEYVAAYNKMGESKGSIDSEDEFEFEDDETDDEDEDGVLIEDEESDDEYSDESDDGDEYEDELDEDGDIIIEDEEPDDDDEDGIVIEDEEPDDDEDGIVIEDEEPGDDEDDIVIEDEEPDDEDGIVIEDDEDKPLQRAAIIKNTQTAQKESTTFKEKDSLQGRAKEIQSKAQEALSGNTPVSNEVMQQLVAQMAELNKNLSKGALNNKSKELTKEEKLQRLRELKRKQALAQSSKTKGSNLKNNFESKKTVKKDYSKYTIDEVYKLAKKFLIDNGVMNGPVDTELLINEFGTQVVNKLLVGSYIIRVGKGVSIGR